MKVLKYARYRFLQPQSTCKTVSGTQKHAEQRESLTAEVEKDFQSNLLSVSETYEDLLSISQVVANLQPGFCDPGRVP